jgi:hypothetical protein
MIIIINVLPRSSVRSLVPLRSKEGKPRAARKMSSPQGSKKRCPRPPRRRALTRRAEEEEEERPRQPPTLPRNQLPRPRLRIPNRPSPLRSEDRARIKTRTRPGQLVSSVKRAAAATAGEAAAEEATPPLILPPQQQQQHRLLPPMPPMLPQNLAPRQVPKPQLQTMPLRVRPRLTFP